MLDRRGGWVEERCAVAGGVGQLVSVLLIAILFLLAVRPTFTAKGGEGVSSCSVRRLLGLSIRRRRGLKFCILTRIPVHVPISGASNSEIMSCVSKA